VLCDALNLKGTKYGCGLGICGSCTVLVDGKATRACVTTLAEAAGRKVTTIEGLAADPQSPLLRSRIAEQVPQCGYCQPGALIAAAGLLDSTLSPNATEITAALDGVLCRCGTYPRMRCAMDRVPRTADLHGSAGPAPD
jgi:aerobic-type carbon monoxide dehydrogenase small subunit (CoxS/CutS family)